MYDLNKIEARCKELSAAVGDTFDIPVQLNGRLTRTLGRVHQEERNRKWHDALLESMDITLLEGPFVEISAEYFEKFIHGEMDGEY